MPPLTNTITSLLLRRNMRMKIKERNSIAATMHNWPVSRPRLKASSSTTMFSSLPSILFSKLLNPRPCISPNTSASRYNNGILRLTVYSRVAKLLMAVIKMVTAIRNSVQSRENASMFKVLSARVTECPMVKAVTSISSFFQSLTT